MTLPAKENPKQTEQKLPRCWLVRAERKGVDEQFNYQAGVVSIHWNDAPDPRTTSRRDLEAFFVTHPLSGGANAAEQIYRFCHEMTIGDVVVTPLWNNSGAYERIMVGLVTGPYRRLAYDPEPAPRQTRAVDWAPVPLERTSLDSARTQDRLEYRYTCRLIHEEDVVRDILTQAGLLEGAESNGKE